MTTTAPGSGTQSHAFRVWVPSIAAGGGALLGVGAVAAVFGRGAVTVLEYVLVVTVAVIGGWLAVYDFRERRLPNRLVFPLYAVVAVLTACCGLLSGDYPRLAIALVAGLALWAVYFVLGLFGAVAYGDVKLAGALGLALGWWGIVPALIGAVAAYVLAFPHAAVYAVTKRGRRIPFGPYMVVGTVAVAVWCLLTTAPGVGA